MEERSFRVVENSTLEHGYNQKQKSDNAATLNDCDDKKREKSSDRGTRHTGSVAATGSATTDDVSETPHSRAHSKTSRRRRANGNKRLPTHRFPDPANSEAPIHECPARSLSWRVIQQRHWISRIKCKHASEITRGGSEKTRRNHPPIHPRITTFSPPGRELLFTHKPPKPTLGSARYDQRHHNNNSHSASEGVIGILESLDH